MADQLLVEVLAALEFGLRVVLKAIRTIVVVIGSVVQAARE